MVTFRLSTAQQPSVRRESRCAGRFCKKKFQHYFFLRVFFVFCFFRFVSFFCPTGGWPCTALHCRGSSHYLADFGHVKKCQKSVKKIFFFDFFSAFKCGPVASERSKMVPKHIFMACWPPFGQFWPVPPPCILGLPRPFRGPKWVHNCPKRGQKWPKMVKMST